MHDLHEALKELNEFFSKLKQLNNSTLNLLESIESRLLDKEYLVSIRPELGHSYKETCRLRNDWKDYCNKWNYLMDEGIKTKFSITNKRLKDLKDLIARVLRLVLTN